MTIEKWMDVSGAKLLTTADTSREIRAGYCCDLLSWVMSHGPEDAAWITVQTHVNVVAVAALLDMACVIIPEGIAVEAATIAKASEKGIALLSSEKSAYALCALLHESGVGEG